jgi:hypothetical protein
MVGPEKGTSAGTRMEPNAGMAPNTLIHLAGIIKALRQRGVFLYDPKAGRKCFYVGQPILQLFASRGKKGGAHRMWGQCRGDELPAGLAKTIPAS